jgi:hypothetical protein
LWYNYHNDSNILPASNHPYEAVALPTNQYWINVCGQIGIQCPDEDHVKNVGGCQTFFGSKQAHVIGKTDQQELRYKFSN